MEFDRECPNCRADIEEDWMYCPWCGQFVPPLCDEEVADG